MAELTELVRKLLEQLLGIGVDPSVFVGLGALVAVLVNVAKHFKLIPDDWAGVIAGAVDLIVILIAVLAGYAGVDLGSIDAILLTVAQIVTAALALFGVSFITHRLGRAASIPLFKPR
jgi:hypothetical protein